MISKKKKLKKRKILSEITKIDDFEGVLTFCVTLQKMTKTVKKPSIKKQLTQERTRLFGKNDLRTQPPLLLPLLLLCNSVLLLVYYYYYYYYYASYFLLRAERKRIKNRGTLTFEMLFPRVEI